MTERIGIPTCKRQEMPVEYPVPSLVKKRESSIITQRSKEMIFFIKYGFLS